MKKTALYEEHVRLGAKIIEFEGWLMPVFYSNVIEEHITTRTKAGLFDICHMGEILIEGPDAFRLVQRLVTADIDKLENNDIIYAVMCYENGTMVDDLLVYCFDDDRYMLVVNAARIENDLNWIRKWSLGFNVMVTDKTDELAKLDLQGPNSEDILQRITKADLKDLKRFKFVEDEIDGVKAIISRTGYTAQDGFELYFDVEKARQQWNRLLEVGKEFGLKPVGLGARDSLRIEACYSLYGHELTEETNPFEAGIGFLVKLAKDDFIGKQALEKIKGQGLKRKIVTFEMLERGIPRQGYPVFKNNVEIGLVTSGTMSPTFKKGLGMAFVKTEEAFEGNEINIKIREKLYKAKIVKRPFYSYKGKK